MDADGTRTETVTGSTWKWSNGGIGSLSLGISSTTVIFRPLNLSGGYEFRSPSGVGIFRINNTGIGFYGRTPAASQELLAPLTDSTGGTSSTTLGDIADGPTADALASLAARITSIESKLVATTLVTQAS